MAKTKVEVWLDDESLVFLKSIDPTNRSNAIRLCVQKIQENTAKEMLEEELTINANDEDVINWRVENNLCCFCGEELGKIFPTLLSKNSKIKFCDFGCLEEFQERKE